MRKHRVSRYRPGWRLALVLVLGLTALPALSPGEKPPIVVGDWDGVLDTGTQGKLRVVIHITQADDGSFGGSLDSSDQGANGIPITTLTYKEPALHFESASIRGAYDGRLNKNNSEISGDWAQGGGKLPLNLKRVH